METMNNSTDKTSRKKSPSRIVWREQMSKGKHTPHRVSHITCTINHLLSHQLAEFLREIGVKNVYIESGRTIKKHIKKRPLGLPGLQEKMDCTPTEVFRFSIPRDMSHQVLEALIEEMKLFNPGRGSVIAQDLIEFYNVEPPRITIPEIDNERQVHAPVQMLHELAFVTCVLTMQGSGDRIAQQALDLGICVPLITSGSNNDLRDQLGLIRITIPQEKEMVHLIMPEHDTENLIPLLMEAGDLYRPGRGFIYRTPVSAGLIDRRMTLGQQEHAASMEQIIAAIDQLQHSTRWRKRITSLEQQNNMTKTIMPDDHCEISVICLEDRAEEMIEIAMQKGAEGATTSRVKRLALKDGDTGTAAQALTTLNVPGNLTSEMVNTLLEASDIGDERMEDRIQILDSPEAYSYDW